MDKLTDNFVLIDGNSLLNRAFYALPPLNNKDGVPTQAVYGFTTMLVKAILDYKPKFLAVAFDLPAPTFRHLKYDGYKATRKKMPDELAVQLPILKEMLRIAGIKILEKPGFEADDIIGTMAKINCRGDGGIDGFNAAACKGSQESSILSIPPSPRQVTYIITGDRDAFQLIDGCVRVVLTRRGLSEVTEFDEKTLAEEFKLTPAQIIDYKALCGDASDNIPGVPGVGEKTALSLLETYKTLDGVYGGVDGITGKLQEKLLAGKESAYLSFELATIDTAVPLECMPSDCAYPFPFSLQVKRFFIDNGFRSLVKREELFAGEKLGGQLSGSGQLTVGGGLLAEDNRRCEVEISSVNTFCELTEICRQWTNEDELFSVGAPQTPSSAVHHPPSTVAVHIGESVHISANTEREHVINITHSLIDPGLDYTQVLAALKPPLENPGISKTVFDAKALKKKLIEYGISLNNYFDVKLAQYLVDMSAPLDSVPDLLAAHGIPGGAPAAGLCTLRDILTQKLSDLHMGALYREIELPLVDILHRMEREGFKVDTAKLREFGADFSQRAAKLSNEIQNEAGQPFNVNSPKQLAKVLFEDLKIPYPKKGGSFSTAAEILEQLEGEYPVVKKILAYRSLAKLNSTYVEGLLNVADARGVVHTEFKQTLTTTGRLSSVEPNLQNIPVREEEGRALRAAFIPKNKDSVLICADYSQIELRLMAHLSGDEGMISAFKAGEDIHASTAAGVFGVPLAEVTSKMRREAKAVNFGIIYGISDFGLAKNLGIPVYQAKQYIESYFARFPQVKQYMDASVALAKSRGYAETLFGRIRKIPELFSPNFNMRSFGERVAMNMPLQGSAADIIKIAMNNVDRALVGKKSKLILQVHDELIIDAPEEEAEEVAALLKSCMESAAVLKVPLVADVGVGKNWLLCK
ncbi:MAG: DNA polymerase I [Firmicutes bacterium]|nr:DNA polymerase I [Bacillota bacterium]